MVRIAVVSLASLGCACAAAKGPAVSAPQAAQRPAASAPAQSQPQQTDRAETAAQQGRVGDVAPLFFRDTENPEASGIARVDMNDLVLPTSPNKRPVVLNFAAQHCEPCLRELQAYAANPKPIQTTEALFVVIVTDEAAAERAQMIARLMKEYALPFAIIDDTAQILARQYGVRDLPHATLVGTDGKIHWVNTGYESETALEELLAAIRASSAMP